jgi:diguanylate cyclase (GGDEF)-like protein
VLSARSGHAAAHPAAVPGRVATVSAKRPIRVQPVHLYCGLVAALGGALIFQLLDFSALVSIQRAPVLFTAFAIVVVVGELMPITLPRRDDSASITISTTFAFAILLAYGTGPAVLALAVASAIGDAATRVVWWKALFNVGQYALAMGACGLLLDSTISLGHGLTGFTTVELLWVVAAGAAFFLVNMAAMTVMLVLDNDTTLWAIVRDELPFQALVTGMLLAIAPIVVLVAESTPLLILVIFIPMVVAYRTLKIARDKDYQALHDGLTGLPNRVLFFRRVEAALREAPSHTGRSVVMVVDLDHFKQINDTLGHSVGDLLLRAVAERIEGVLNEGDSTARLGGDEFGVLLRNAIDRAEVESVAARIIDVLEQPFTIDSTRLDVGASIGSTLFPEHGEQADILVQRAEIAMDVAKAGAGGHVVYSPSHDQHSPERLALVGELRQAIGDRSLRLYYQPKISLRTGEVIGLEALARWIHPQRGFIPPDEFIPLAERTGLIRPLTMLVIEEALRQSRELRQAGYELSVAVNLSARTLQDVHFPDELARLLADAGVEARWLHLEITESMIMEDRARSMEVLDRLHAMGHPLSIDDFGTGYSSLAYLKRLPVDEIKIDKSFILNMAVDTDDEMIARSTVDLGHNLRLRVVAEGVETPEAWHKLAAMGCDQAQGYLMSRPLPPDELGRWLAGWKPRQVQWLPIG